MKVLVVLFVLISVSLAYSIDLKNPLPSVGKTKVEALKDTDLTLQALTKELKNLQNDKGPIVFKTGSAVLDTAKCEKTLKTLNDIVEKFPGYLVEIDGHTDNAGKPKANLVLSQKRAEAVMAYEISKYKTSAKRLSAKGFGDTQPIASNKTPEGRTKNRRVDFSVFRMK
jgi:outer membrane protein OmpA-like peptidoglycan-associated protein